MKSCLEAARIDGHQTIWLGVWEKNAQAIRFYEKWDFKKVGTKEFILGSDRQIDDVMERPVEPTA
ncbi:MAG: GNAT family N-acetyltransferase [Planctomycetota bacterium]|jgi:ribosomal protein S18 acetylase RimI-like enzyme